MVGRVRAQNSGGRRFELGGEPMSGLTSHPLILCAAVALARGVNTRSQFHPGIKSHVVKVPEIWEAAN
jgi:hypothetical protein